MKWSKKELFAILFEILSFSFGIQLGLSFELLVFVYSLGLSCVAMMIAYEENLEHSSKGERIDKEG
jgi:hypothetical protein